MTTPDQLSHTHTQGKGAIAHARALQKSAGRGCLQAPPTPPRPFLPLRGMGDTGPFAAPAPRGARKRGRGVGRGAGLHPTGEPVFDDKHPSWQVCIGVVACLRGPQDLRCVGLCHNEGALP
jgi:hypothetical protein